jgi:surface antigen
MEGDGYRSAIEALSLGLLQGLSEPQPISWSRTKSSNSGQVSATDDRYRDAAKLFREAVERKGPGREEGAVQKKRRKA